MMRGQIPQLFIFLMAILVIGATLFIGIKVFGMLDSSACEANDAAFMRDIKGLIDENAVYGNKNSVSLRSPCDATAICFVDKDALGSSGFIGNDTTITLSVRNAVQTNIFLKGRDKTVPVGFDERIILREPDEPVPPLNDRCIEAVSGKLSFRTRGYGRYIVIS
jgi:hypothetical protein